MKNFVVELEHSNIVVRAAAADTIEAVLKSRSIIHGVREPNPAVKAQPAKGDKPAVKAQPAEDEGATPMTLEQLGAWLDAQ